MFRDLQPISIKRVLYATDLSESAKYALSYAVDLANVYGAQLVLLHVLDKTPEIVDGQVVGYIGSKQWDKIKTGYDEEFDALLQRRRRGKEVMERILKRCRRDFVPESDCDFDLEDEVVVRRGQPVKVILETAKEKNCDLIVMGSHGHSRLVDAMLGVTATRVVRRSEIPVFVVRLPKEKK